MAFVAELEEEKQIGGGCGGENDGIVDGIVEGGCGGRDPQILRLKQGGFRHVIQEAFAKTLQDN